MMMGILLFSLTGCKYKEMNIDNDKKEKFMLGYTLDDGRLLSLTMEPLYSYGDMTLGEAIFDGTLSVEQVIDKLNYVAIFRDGGSKLYSYDKISKIFGDEDFYMLVCNSLDGNKNIYVAKYRENLDNKCTLKIDDIDGVSMVIKEGTLSKTGATVIITDTSDRDNIYGEYYRLEKEVNGKWIQLETKEEMAFISIGYKVGKDHTLELNINWETLYGELDEGKYRILKNTSEPGEGTEHYITAEFVIE